MPLNFFLLLHYLSKFCCIEFEKNANCCRHNFFVDCRMCWPSATFLGYWRSRIRQSGAEVCSDSGVLCVYCHVTNFSLSRFGYWISGKGTISHSSSVVAYLIAHSRILILSLLRMACLRSAESVREFVSAVTSTEAAAGIYTLIRNSVDIDYYTNQCRSQCACFALARTACWLCQQDSYNKITNNIEIHRVRSHFTFKATVFSC